MPSVQQIFTILSVFVPLSLSAVGGGASTLAPLQHQAVEVHHWITNAEFAHLFAISRAAPGPGSMLSTLVGWEIDGWFGAAIVTLALYVPAAVLCYGMGRIWNRYRNAAWHGVVSEALAPVGTGLVLAGALAIARVSNGGFLAWSVAGASIIVLRFRPTLHPFIILSAGAAAFVAAWALANPALFTAHTGQL